MLTKQSCGTDVVNQIFDEVSKLMLDVEQDKLDLNNDTEVALVYGKLNTLAGQINKLNTQLYNSKVTCRYSGQTVSLLKAISETQGKFMEKSKMIHEDLNDLISQYDQAKLKFDNSDSDLDRVTLKPLKKHWNLN